MPDAPTHTRPLVSGDRIDPHRHDDHQIVYAGSGFLAVTTDAGTWFAPGTRALWVPAGTVHSHRAHGNLDMHTLGLPVEENPLGLTVPTVLSVSPLLRELILAYTDAARYGTRTSRPARAPRVPGPPTPERLRLRAVLLDQLRASPQQPVHLPAPADPRLAAVCDLLHADPADPATLAELGSRTHTGERTLSRLFRSELGMTFPQWRTQLRLFHALRMLAEGTPVTAVAHRCGWASASAFIDVFRRAYGHTPGAHLRGDTAPRPVGRGGGGGPAEGN
ncbi:AraC family transcriptional regulator [Streptomyces sp. NPDC004111]|uniref:AraC family transcriptional regulator n=1 Tax=Streptomyces sp. NPDC004111 TaxID=3364690 RepID=UPI0036C35685